MSEIELDERGILIACPTCGQRNRLAYRQLDRTVRCGHCKTRLDLPTAPIDINSEPRLDQFVDASAVPILVDFLASWCGPCKMMAPELEKVAGRSAGKFVVAKANTEQLPGIASRSNISAIPTLALFAGGREISRVSGARPASGIEEFVRGVLRH